MVGHGEGHEVEHADGSVAHDDAGHLDHDFGAGVEEHEGGTASVAEHAESEAEQDGEEDDLEHVALGQSVNRVQRHDVHEHLDERRRGNVLHLQVFHGERQTETGTEQIGENKTDNDGHGRREQIINKRF